ncbi:uncharacterized protein GIQ15_03993 [Arthroderma uncinatum]|uniref:uncharacterized protein n=1 Tax=Arthroderma uncinatum TaxID=74035 RepID=UPI00144AD110|nr:uncharacterized protein GIQ15_03993 [Arthroderma uncinatum]KAF3481234.1 hypothetical protein GIQ15_03993 [Arthroderma uncinatum]
MPSPHTPRRTPNRGSAKQSPTKPLDLGESLGPHDTATVREKVRKWQQLGGGVVIAPDVGASSDEGEKGSPGSKLKESKQATNKSPASKRPRTPKGKSSPEPEKKPVRSPTKTKTTPKKSPRTTPRTTPRNTPKKRVVSDAHWRRNRSPPSASAPSSAHPTPTKRTDVLNKYEQAKEKAARTSAIKDSDGIAVYPGPLRVPEPLKAASSAWSSDLGSSAGEGTADPSVREKTAAQHRTPKRTLKPNYCVNEDSHRTASPRKKVQSPEFVSRASTPRKKPPSPEQVDSPPEPAPVRAEPVRRSDIRTRNLLSGKTNIISQVIDESKKMFSMKPPEPSPPVQPPQEQATHGSKVEAWLSSTADPFVEDNDESTVSMPAPLKSSSTRKDKDHTDDEHSNEDTKKRRSLNTSSNDKKHESKPAKGRYDYSDGSESESNETHKLKSTSHARESKSDLSFESASESQPSTLKRGKATKSRSRLSASAEAERMSMLRESVEEALQGSSLDRPTSSDGSEVSAVDRPPPLMLKRPFPSTGVHRLSTIASMDTLTSSTNPDNTKEQLKPISQSELSQNEDDAVSESEKRDTFDPQSLPGPVQPLKRRLTKHADLMSVLSIPGAGSRSIRSARSIRTNRSRLATATVSDIMRELASDEVKYMRELRTLVGGVIPVLLTSILSKTDSAIAAGLFRRSANPSDQENFTRPIVNMGVSLEKLKGLHKRMPLNNPEALLSWAVGAQKVYADYLSAWRLGFQDVVVNLAPPDPEDALKAETQSLCAGMAQDENGDVINGDGERVDVAFLLKRPLVRLKYLSKTFKGLNYVQPSPKAEEVAGTYQSLVTDARRRANEERSRLEDDAAASIDATRARSLHTLGVLKDVDVNQARRVRARDYFDLSLLHSTGQQIDCRAELLLRDNPPGEAPGGDLFICEIDETDRWLLFPPIDCTCISARNGDGEGEIVLMVREQTGNSTEWYELLSLTTDDEQIGFEWVQMIGLNPVPPKINRSLSFVNRAKDRKERLALARQGEDGDAISVPDYNASEVDVPIGEKATVAGEDLKHDRDTANRGHTEAHAVASPSTPSRILKLDTPRSLNEAMDLAGSVSPSTLKRSKAKRRSKYDYGGSPISPTSSGVQTPDKEFPRPPSPLLSRGGSDVRGRDRTPSPTTPTSSGYKQTKRPIAALVQPHGRRSLSPVPSLEFPMIPKLRKGSSPKPSPPPSPKSIPLPASPVQKTSEDKAKQSPVVKSKKSSEKAEKSGTHNDDQMFTEDVPSPPPHRTPSPAGSKRHKDPIISPPAPQYARHRRTSSPLKHEYAPSTASESSGSDTSSIQRYDIESSSDTSSDEELEDDDMPTPLRPVPSIRAPKRTYDPESADNRPATAETVSPPESAYRSPPKSIHSSPQRPSKTIASIFYWHDKGSWEPLHLDECNIIVTPGLIEAFEMVPGHSRPTSRDDGSGTDSNEISRQPLIALELTPLVPIRRGTALDISIRSPPTPQSKISSGSNIMFRSRNPDECEKLYGLINYSRINNPTYIALQNAHGPQHTPLSRHNSTRSNKGGGWFSWYGGFSKSSYRASTAPPASLAGGTDSSVGTMSSAFSALKRFGGGSKMFSIARSTLTSRNGSRDATSLYTTSTGSGSGQRFPSTNPETANIAAEGGIGLANAKIRIYARESAAKWRDLGAARLTIMPADPASSNTPPRHQDDQGNSGTSTPASGDASSADTVGPPRTPPSAARPGARGKDEKRILVRSKASGETLVDACLGESSFERVARTGIAVSIWEEFEGIAKEGGVVGGSFKVYMIQMKSEAEAAYTFGLVGKLRY